MENHPICRYREQIYLIERAANVSTNDLKKIIQAIENSDVNNYLKCSYISDIAQISYRRTNNIEVAKSIIIKAIKYADIGQLHGIASDCYEVTHDKDFTVDLYVKAINLCYEANNTSRLHLLGQSMLNIDAIGDNYFHEWGEAIKAEAVALNNKNKAEKKFPKDRVY